MQKNFWKRCVQIALMSVALPVLLTGCIHFEYEGESFPATEDVEILDVHDMPGNWKEIGRAVVSGNYQQVDQNDLLDRLLEEALAHGAEALAVTAVRTMPLQNVDPEDELSLAIDQNNSAEGNSWNSLMSDYDRNYGSVGVANVRYNHAYMLVIYAAFYRDLAE